MFTNLLRTNIRSRPMVLRLNALATTELSPRIVVFGVGGAGGNAVNNMIEDNLQGVDFVVANTDSQALHRSKAERKIQIGLNTTQGLGAGANPQIGMAAAEESQAEIMEHLGDAHMVFITAGMGGGTGTGAAPIIARTAREMGILTVAVVTKPFHFEGTRRMKMADAGLSELQKNVDTLIVIPNQNLFRVANDKTTFQQAFQMADKVLHSGVRGVTDLMIMPGLINLDFADVKSVMSCMGKAMMGTGEAEGDDRARKAANLAINNPLLEDVSLKGAKAVLIHVTGGNDMTLFELDEAANQVKDEVDPEANIIVGSTFDEALEGKIRVSVVASGIDEDSVVQPVPEMQSARTVQASAPQQPIQVVRVTQRETYASAPTPAPQPQPQPQQIVQEPELPMTAREPIHHQQEPVQAQMPLQEPERPHYDINSQQHLVREAQRELANQRTQNYQPAQPAQPAPKKPVEQSHAQPHRSSGAGLLNIFGRPKPRPTQEDTYQENIEPNDEPMYNDDINDDDYSIPAFLRRQAN